MIIRQSFFTSEKRIHYLYVNMQAESSTQLNIMLESFDKYSQ